MTLTRSETTSTRTGSPPLRGWWALVLTGGLLGIVGTIWQTVERMSSLAHAGRASVCDVNAVVSCTGVYTHWQSSALGVPNSLIGLPVFAIMTSAALGALLGSAPSRSYLATLFGLSVFMTSFVFWYMEQTAFVMGALCLFCTASMVNIMLTGIGLTRIADGHDALGHGRLGRTVRRMVRSGVDVAAWIGLAGVVAVMLLVGLAL